MKKVNALSMAVGLLLLSGCAAQASPVQSTNTEPTESTLAPPTSTPEPTAMPTSVGPIPLTQAHAHNDYLHDRPLFDALDRGFTSVEVDIYLVNGELLVAHDVEDTLRGRTLQLLYLNPLRRYIQRHNGQVYSDGSQLTLLIDIKSEAGATYEVLREILRDYRDILTAFGPDGLREQPVIVIISGNRPRQMMVNESVRYAAYDGRLEDLGSNAPATFIPLISDRWTTHFTWNGQGPMPEGERKNLIAIVEAAHAEGRRVRFWATPDEPSLAREAVWQELVAANVDLINTDDLDGLQQFLLNFLPQGL